MGLSGAPAAVIKELSAAGERVSSLLGSALAA